MTPDEALAVVKKAVELLPWLEEQSKHSPAQVEVDILSAALRAIAPDGPLVAVPRKPTQAMIDAGIDAGWIDGDDINPEDLYRAMIEEASKP